MTVEQFAPLMFLGLILVMLIGFPVAFSLAALGLFCGLYAIDMGWFPANFLGNLPLNVFGILSNELLLAIPFFTLMGSLLEKCGLAEDMLDSMGQLFGPVRGGLGYSVIIVGFILGAITGTVAGQVIAMAMISLPVMIRYGYDMKYATGVLAASGTITQLVPPSLVLVVMADQLGQSVGDMYKGAWGPSILQILFFAIYTFILGRIYPHHVPGVPREARTLQGWALWKKCLRGIIPSAILIFTVLGSWRLARHQCGDCHPHRGRCHGRGRCIHLGGHPRSLELATDQGCDGRHHAHHRHGGVHPDWLARFLTGVPGRGRRQMDRAFVERPARWAGGLFDRGEHLYFLLGVFPRLL